jgi:hypothetical protein
VSVIGYTIVRLTALLLKTGILFALSLTFPIFLIPTATSEVVVIFDLVFAAALWVVVAAIAVANSGQVSRQQAYRS